MSSPNPYEPPPLPEPEAEHSPPRAAATDDEYEIPPFRSPRWLSVVCVLLFGVVIAHAAAAAYVEINLYWLYDETMPEEVIDTQAVLVGQFWLGLIDVITWPLSIVTHLWLMAWMFRCHRNLEALGHRELDSKHIWAVLCWFIPVLNLFCPYQVMREIWWRSQPLAKTTPDSVPATHMVFWWWLLWVTRVATSYLAQWFSSYETWPQYHTFLRTILLSCGCEIISSLLVIIIVHRISQWQMARYQLLSIC